MSNRPDALERPLTTPSVGLTRLPQLKALTSIRFFAALHVAVYHMIRPFAYAGIFAGLVGCGYQGVSFFFILSGYILTYAHATEYELGRGDWQKFLFARFARIYPVYLLAMLLAGLDGLQVLRTKSHWIAFLADLLLLQAWSMRTVNFFNAGAWTLCCEAFFYMVFPLVLMRVRPRHRTGAWLWIGVFFALAMAAPLACLHFFPLASQGEIFAQSPGAGTVFLVSRLPVFAVPEFFCGISLAWLFLRFKPSKKASAVMAWLGTLGLGAALLGADFIPYIALHNGLLFPLYALVLLGLSQTNALERLLSASWLVLLGEASFALYLFHILVINLTDHLGWGMTWGPMFLRLAFILPVTILIHLGLERPCRNWLMGWWRRQHAAPAN